MLSSLFTATAVTLAGCIGFIGLIIPHTTRLLAGYDHRITLPVSMLLGGSLLTIADTLARSLFAPQQLPVGILMAMIGVPIFIWLLQK
jgi:iron complex transport system permease protein